MLAVESFSYIYIRPIATKNIHMERMLPFLGLEPRSRDYVIKTLYWQMRIIFMNVNPPSRMQKTIPQEEANAATINLLNQLLQ